MTITCVGCGKQYTYEKKRGRIRKVCDNPSCVNKCKKVTSKSWTKKQHPTYGIYNNILQRCNNPNHPDANTYYGVQVAITCEDLCKFYNSTTTCTKCGVIFEVGRKGGCANSRSIDRKDITKGYTLENIQWLCKVCNTKKYYTEDKYKVAEIEIVCRQCGKIFSCKHKRTKYCSPQCKWKAGNTQINAAKFWEKHGFESRQEYNRDYHRRNVQNQVK